MVRLGGVAGLESCGDWIGCLDAVEAGGRGWKAVVWWHGKLLKIGGVAAAGDVRRLGFWWQGKEAGVW